MARLPQPPAPAVLQAMLRRTEDVIAVPAGRACSKRSETPITGQPTPTANAASTISGMYITLGDSWA